MSQMMLRATKVRGPRQNLRKQNEAARRGSATASGGKIEKIPPKVYPNPIRSVTRRYETNTAFSAQTFTQSTLYNQFLMVVVAATGNAISYADMVRIKKIKAWVFGFGSSFEIQPLTGDIQNQFCSPERTFSANCISTAFPATLVVKPRNGQDPLGGWKESNTTNFAQTLLLLNFAVGPAGGSLILDVSYDYIENIVGGPNGYGMITSTLVLGTMGSVTPFAPLVVSGSNQL